VLAVGVEGSLREVFSIRDLVAARVGAVEFDTNLLRYMAGLHILAGSA
jgi:hypothetical protein